MRATRQVPLAVRLLPHQHRRPARAGAAHEPRLHRCPRRGRGQERALERLTTIR